MSDDDFRTLPLALQAEIREIRQACLDMDSNSGRY